MKRRRQPGKYNYCGEKIRDIRQKKKLSQEQLAVKAQLLEVDITQKMISLIELGDRVVTDYELRCFAQVLGVSAAYLLDLEN